MQQIYSISVRDQIKRASPCLQQQTADVLADMYQADKLYGTESERLVAIDKVLRISIEQGAAMHRLMRSNSVKRSLEIGLANGFSTVWMLDALCKRRNALHIAIDPYQKILFHGVGLAQINRLLPGARFEWVETFSIHALSDLIRKNERFDFIFIDGNHRFDDVMADFYLSHQILRNWGLIAFDDMCMPAVRTATNFILNNRSYAIVEQPVENMLVMRKMDYDRRDWQHFNGFQVDWPPEKAEHRPPHPSVSLKGVIWLRNRLRRMF
ncbi:MAG: class I SAM-dependent methyltransferase [Methylocapsa sp.]|nr:class I SAM-dependent methyltransferase [Methylocapsa sp.]